MVDTKTERNHTIQNMSSTTTPVPPSTPTPAPVATPKAQPRFDAAFKAGAVRSWTSSGKSARVVAHELGIKPNCLYRWRDEMAPSPAVPPSAKADSNADLRAQLNAALHELRRVTEQRDILKKTLGILSEPRTSAANALTR